VRPLKANGKRIYMIVGADARAVRPYMYQAVRKMTETNFQ